MPSTGIYEPLPQPPGPVVTVTDPGGGDGGRDITVTMRWEPADVIVGQPYPPGASINLVNGACTWNVQRGAGVHVFKLDLRSNGPATSVRAHVLVSSRAGSWTGAHRIPVPGRTNNKKTKQKVTAKRVTKKRVTKKKARKTRRKA